MYGPANLQTMECLLFKTLQIPDETEAGKREAPTMGPALAGSTAQTSSSLTLSSSWVPKSAMCRGRSKLVSSITNRRLNKARSGVAGQPGRATCTQKGAQYRWCVPMSKGATQGMGTSARASCRRTGLHQPPREDVTKYS
jgi:hypothetical protein